LKRLHNPLGATHSPALFQTPIGLRLHFGSERRRRRIEALQPAHQHRRKEPDKGRFAVKEAKKVASPILQRSLLTFEFAQPPFSQSIELYLHAQDAPRFV